jgi:hypothetical protein
MSVTYTLVRTEVYTVEMEDVSQASEERAIDLVFSRSIDPDATELDITVGTVPVRYDEPAGTSGDSAHTHSSDLGVVLVPPPEVALH